VLGTASFFAVAADAPVDILYPGVNKPANAIALFRGSRTDEWVQRGSNQPCKWKTNPQERSLVAGGGDIVTKRQFGAYQLHVEWKEPQSTPEQKGQDRGNSGIYQQDRYELQVLDSFNNETYANGACGAIYGEAAPLKNVSLPPLQWQTYDITLTPAKFENGKKVANARITVYQNGELIQDNTEIKKGPTPGGAPEADSPGPLRLQDHGHPVEFRDIWIVPLDDKATAPEVQAK
jgi:hypothetical protein